MSWKEHRAAFLVGTAATVAGGIILAFNWADVWNWLNSAWQWVTGSAAHPRWLLGLLWLSVIGWVLFALTRVGEPPAPSHVSYQQDNFFNVVWRWNWDFDRVTEVTPFCPQCDLQIIPHNDSNSLRLACSECQKTFIMLAHKDEPQLRREVELRVLRNTRKNQESRTS